MKKLVIGSTIVYVLHDKVKKKSIKIYIVCILDKRNTAEKIE